MGLLWAGECKGFKSLPKLTSYPDISPCWVSRPQRWHGLGTGLPDPNLKRTQVTLSNLLYPPHLSLETFIAAAVGAAVGVGAAPVVLTAMGFTGTGIAAASIAAKMMSAAAIANGGGVAAGSMVAAMQSAGVLGLSTSTNVIVGTVGAAAAAILI
ncbi:interferon alpha-inducible protein 27-like protein 2A [Alexandromys fortis]|uniref:interferon alpha-inducible protein 27-like protein 2A n=1 Tax=Alexandromys fortis TaxID=100897 RepID=UPI0021532601|nr:interferon alpha-inducible protein 27-like protein 2A [Microtus fortis]